MFIDLQYLYCKTNSECSKHLPFREGVGEAEAAEIITRCQRVLLKTRRLLLPRQVVSPSRRVFCTSIEYGPVVELLHEQLMTFSAAELHAVPGFDPDVILIKAGRRLRVHLMCRHWQHLAVMPWPKWEWVRDNGNTMVFADVSWVNRDTTDAELESFFATGKHPGDTWFAVWWVAHPKFMETQDAVDAKFVSKVHKNGPRLSAEARREILYPEGQPQSERRPAE